MKKKLARTATYKGYLPEMMVYIIVWVIVLMAVSYTHLTLPTT